MIKISDLTKNRFLIISCGKVIEEGVLNDIENILKEKNVKKGFILKLIKEKVHLHLVEASLGFMETQDVYDSILHFQKIKFDHDSPLIQVLRKLHLSSDTKMVLRDKLKFDIIDYFNKNKPKIVIFHFPKGCFLKSQVHDIIDQIKDKIGENNVYILENIY